MPNNHQLDYTLDLGGNHVDYAPIVDPTTDWSASQVNAIAGTVAGLSQVTPVILMELAWSSGTPLLSVFRSSLKNVSVVSLTKISTGIVSCVVNIAQTSLDNRSVTFQPSTYSVSSCATSGGYAFGTARTFATSSTTITIYIQCYSSAGALNDDGVHNVMVF